MWNREKVIELRALNISVFDLNRINGDKPWERENWLAGLDPKRTQLIQIQDTVDWPYDTAWTEGVFAGVFTIKFNDVEEGATAFNQQQAQQLAQVMLDAKTKGLHLVAQCHFGVARSGAVVEVAEKLGWVVLEEVYRNPNKLVVDLLQAELLGLAETQPNVEEI